MRKFKLLFFLAVTTIADVGCSVDDSEAELLARNAFEQRVGLFGESYTQFDGPTLLTQSPGDSSREYLWVNRVRPAVRFVAIVSSSGSVQVSPLEPCSEPVLPDAECER